MRRAGSGKAPRRRTRRQRDGGGYGQVRMGSAHSRELWQSTKSVPAAHPSRPGARLRPQALCQHSLVRFPRGKTPRASTRTSRPDAGADRLAPDDDHKAATNRTLRDSRDTLLTVQLAVVPREQALGTRLPTCPAHMAGFLSTIAVGILLVETQPGRATAALRRRIKSDCSPSPWSRPHGPLDFAEAHIRRGSAGCR